MRWCTFASLLLGAGLVASCPALAAESPVHLLLPGFSVEELPVRLSNQNNLRFGPDGVLTALGYDGKIWRLRDADGDGLEDTAEPYWDRPTLSVPLGMAWSTHGLFVSSKGKVSVLRDTDADGRADQEEVVASGWPATDVGSGGVDATAVTLDRQGNVYFGLLVADYSNAYRLRKRRDLKPGEVEWLQKAGRWREPVGPDSGNDEFSLYDPASPRGSIQRWDSRTRKLETFATGLRVPVALAFNNAGDLFNTDQEGETWMPNGNPLDELYWPLIGDPGRVRVLASGVVDGAEKPLVWTFERGAPDGRKSRVVGSILGHYFWTLDDPLYRLMVLRAIAWAGGGEPELLKDAALIEANLE